MAKDETVDKSTKLVSLQQRVKAIDKAKTAAETELSLVEVQYNEKVAQLKELGVEDLTDLPLFIKQAEEELAAKVEDTEANISAIEQKLK